ncbi:c-di-GMP-binding flagellar brake protein YcgR [Paenibacillus phyllosphaerae]|uniref:C-di-GMP-binding flagellar brake protein YcgR n=1 Tax=Paenibacillus phyllosphaerae TaxID=274593 RepID=A0A7W5ATS3_9BACL|nr:PilZ domain-containing protein [Paenibacillus phyllosphaerae]MBB3108633.1 c-di-GMP-binding flagellar brake protein YcgR [Paenibacillus phyllosphaerae]
MQMVNKREFFRVDLKIPLSALLKIIAVSGNVTDTKYSKIAIKDISAGGIRMHSRLNLPVHVNLLLEFSFQLFNENVKLIGAITRKTEIAPALFEYGIQFYLDINKERQLISNLNQLTARLRNMDVLSSCSFCSDEELDEFYDESTKNKLIHGESESPE